MKRILLAPDSDPGLPPGDPGATPTPPPAAKVVVEGTKTEREIQLEADLKARETRINELEDENHQLKKVTEPPKPPRAPAPKKGKWTFFHED